MGCKAVRAQAYLGVGQGQVRGAAVRGADEDASAVDGDDGSFMEALPPGAAAAGAGDDDEDPYMAATPGAGLPALPL